MRCAVFLSCCLMLAGSIRTAAQSGTQRCIIDRIEISGNTITRRAVILRELSVAEGDTIECGHFPIATENKRRLTNLSIFTTVDISSLVAAEGHIVLRIAVRERWPLIPRPLFQLADRNFNVWWSEMHRDLRRINVGVTITDNNFRGNLEQLSITVQAGYTQRLALAYLRPYLDRKQRHGIGFSVGVAQSGELPYATDSNKFRFARLPGTHIIRQYDFAAAWYYRRQYALRHSLTLAYHHADISDTVLRLNSDYFGGSHSRQRYADLTYRVDYNGVDNWNYPLSGIKSINYVVLRKGFDGGLDWQAQVHTETGYYGRLSRYWLYDLTLRGRLSAPGDVPYAFRGALGTKTDYVRGYEYYVVDGTHYAVLRADVKRPLTYLSFRLPFRYLPELPLRIYPKLFADAGIVHDPQPGNSFLHDRMLYAAGIGVDVVSAYDFKMRIEAAVNHLGQYGLYLHLNSE